MYARGLSSTNSPERNEIPPKTTASIGLTPSSVSSCSSSAIISPMEWDQHDHREDEEQDHERFMVERPACDRVHEIADREFIGVVEEDQQGDEPEHVEGDDPPALHGVQSMSFVLLTLLLRVTRAEAV